MSEGGASKSYAVRFRPAGPWRFGPDSGARDRVDLICHSDAVFSAVCSAMSQLGFMEDWLGATARSAAPAVRFSSLYPFRGDTLLVVPPRSLWPPTESAKVRCKGARFVPLSVVASLLDGKAIDENRWAVDGESKCLVSSDGTGGPFRIAVRSSAGVDRLQHGNVEPHATACLEFARDAGLWTVVEFANDDAAARWEAPVRSALRLLADSGFGGERSRGWGRSEAPEWEPWMPPQAASTEEPGERAYWLLSVFTPSAGDAVDWSRGSYSTVSRRGRIESSARWGEPKSATVMIEEGSVLLAGAELQGAARDVAPAGFPHPVYRAGFALTVPIPWRASV
ncbi:MAG: type III-A CRISPR-associated RAMP protein Csm4 [Acidobacteriia bacterium]|nr:type III-A CRISPR-associated RAMP protein Csm4 [Terriglobia bacterium]